MATVKLFGNLRQIVEPSQLQIPGESIREVVESLCNEHPSLCDMLLEDGQIRPHYKITLNGHDIQFTAGLDTTVSEEDQIAIFPPIAGG